MSAAAALYLKLTTPSGNVIAGESRAAKFKGLIELEDWKWSLARRKTDKSNPTRAGDVDRAEPSVLRFSKLMDRSTTAMLSHMRLGSLLKAELTLEDASEDQAFSLILHMTNVRIIDYSFDIRAPESQAEAHVDEDWTLDYETIKFDFTPDGKKGRTDVTFRREADASTDKPGGTTDKILSMARNLEVGQLDELWKQLKEDAEKRRLNPGVKATSEE
jgi:type VI protein secretion system component Hcp